MTNRLAPRRRLVRLEEGARALTRARDERIRQALANDPDGRAGRLLVGVLARTGARPRWSVSCVTSACRTRPPFARKDCANTTPRAGNEEAPDAP